MVLGTVQHAKNLPDISIPFRDEIVGSVHTFKYLGVMIDRNLKFVAHVIYLKQKVFSRLKALGRAGQFVDQKLARTPSLHVIRCLLGN